MRTRLATVALLVAVAASAGAQAGGDSVYSTPALRALVAAVAARNREPPPALRGYRADVETEIGFVLRDTLGREFITQVEQLAARARWQRGGDYELHVVGYRSQSAGFPFSALGLMRSWSVPTLYGDRLDVGLEPAQGPAARRGKRGGADSVHAVHPLASDREAYYRFQGGDTIVTLRTATGATPIVRVNVVPRVEHPDVRLALFEGEIDIDPVRLALVRMRGRLLVEGRAIGGRPLLARLPGLVAAAYMELVNGELEGQYWLPTYQRTELQVNLALLGENRSILRIVSRFGGHELDLARDSGVYAADSSRHHLRTVTFASRDTLDNHTGWERPLGATTASVSGADFDEFAPPAWRSQLPRSRIDMYPRKIDDVFRYDRIEGAYTGLSLTAESRDAGGAKTARVFGGWAWREATARGGVSLGASRRGEAVALRAERELASTNDFAGALSGGATFGALFGIDDADYVDRRLVAVDLTRAIGANGGYLQLELDGASDRPDSARLTRGLFIAGSGLRPNRGAARGRYALVGATAELNPNVTGVFLDPGVGLRLHAESASGELSWSRVEAMLTGRRATHDVVWQARIGGGAVFGRAMPPQQLFELGQNEDLAGYAYKEFGGDRAAVGHLRASYTAPLLRRPHRVWRTYFVPGLSPGLAAGIDGGWAGVASTAARQALLELGTMLQNGVVVPVSRPSESVRASVDLRVTAFGGAASFGIARPVDHRAPWRLVAGIGQ